MQRTNLLKAIPLSFYSKEFYGEVGRHWRGRGILYMLVLLAIFSLIGSAVFLERAVRHVDQLISVIAPQIPTITIKEGIAQTAKSETISVVDQQNNPIILINTSENYHGDFKSHPAIVMVTRDAIWVKFDVLESNKMEVYPFSKTWSGTVDSVSVKHFYERLKTKRYLILYPIFVVVCLMTLFLYRLIYSLIYAAIGLIFSRIHKGHLTYAALINLSLVTMTPVLVIRFMLLLYGIQVMPAIYWIFLLANFIYLYLAVKWASSRK